MKYVIINKERTSYEADVEFMKHIEEEMGEPAFYMFSAFDPSLDSSHHQVIESPLEKRLFELVIEKEERLSQTFQQLNDAKTYSASEWYNNKNLKFCGRKLNIPSPPFRFQR